MDILDAHILHIQEKYKKKLDDIQANIGWVRTDDSILSKIYDKREIVETSFIDGVYVYRILSMD